MIDSKGEGKGAQPPLETEWWVIVPCLTESAANKIMKEIGKKTGYMCLKPREVAK